MTELKRFIFILIFLFVFRNGFAQDAALELFILITDKANPDAELIIKDYIPFKGDSLAITTQLVSFLDELKNSGFNSASVDSVSFLDNKALAYVYIGKKYFIQHIKISATDSSHSNISFARINYPVGIRDLQNIKKQIIQDYENAGFPFAIIKTDSLTLNDSIIEVKLCVDPGNAINIGDLVLKGDARIKSHYINRYLGIKTGDLFSQQIINQIEVKIKNLSFIEQIKPPELEFRKNKADIYLYLKNKKANQFNGIIGFFPASDKSKDLVITGDLSLGLVNSFGRGEALAFRWEKLESSTQRLDVSLQYPYIFKSPFGLDLNFNLFKQDSSFLNLDYTIGADWQASTNSKLKIYYRYQSSSIIKELIDTRNLADVNSSVIGLAYKFTNIDYLINPHRGVDVSLYGGAGKKEIKELKLYTDTLDTESIDFTTFEAGLGLDIFIPVYKNFVFHFGNITRYTGRYDGAGANVVFYQNEMYRFGGARSLRGFDEHAFFASIYSLQNMELRYLFEQNSAFYIFWNGAYYYQPLPEKTTEDFPWGVGVGLNFDTKAGNFSISYALGKQFDNPMEINAAKIHFGYISRF